MVMVRDAMRRRIVLVGSPKGALRRAIREGIRVLRDRLQTLWPRGLLRVVQLDLGVDQVHVRLAGVDLGVGRAADHPGYGDGSQRPQDHDDHQQFHERKSLLTVHHNLLLYSPDDTWAPEFYRRKFTLTLRQPIISDAPYNRTWADTRPSGSDR